MDFLAAMKSRNAATKGKRAVNENDMSCLWVNISMPSHIWNPIASKAAITPTLACRKKALKLAVAAMWAVMSIIIRTRYGIFSEYLMLASAPSGPMMVAKMQKNMENIRAVAMPKYNVWILCHILGSISII